MKTFDRADVQLAPKGSLFVLAEDYCEAINVLKDLARQEDFGREDVCSASPAGRAWRLIRQELREDNQLWER